MEDEFLINTNKQQNLPLHRTVQTVLFGYSFFMTFIAIIFVSLFTWKMVEYTPLLKYQITLPDYIKKNCINLAPINETEYSLRRSKLQQILQTTSTKYYIMEPGPSMIYFTGVKWKLSERAFLFVIPDQGETFFVSPKFEETKARENINGQRIVTWQENESPYIILGNQISVDNSTVIAVAPETRLFIRDGIASLGSQLINGFPLESKLRMIKSRNELNIMSCANNATKQVFKEIYESGVIKTGISESELRGYIMEALDLVGLKNTWSIVLFGQNAAFPHGNYNGSTLKDNDFILMDIGGSLYDYQSDITRTYKNIEKSSNQPAEDAWEVVKRAQEAAIQKIIPGVTCSSIDKAARDIIDNSPWAGGYKYFSHRLGHGLGIQGHEDPYFVDKNEVILEPGMVLTVEPGIYVQGQFGIRIEDVIVVTKTGRKVLGDLMTNFNKPY